MTGTPVESEIADSADRNTRRSVANTKRKQNAPTVLKTVAGNATTVREIPVNTANAAASTPPVMRAHLEALAPQFDAGWTELEIPIEVVGWARFEMIKLAAEVEVLSPPELREAVADVARRVSGYYAG